MRKLPGSLLLLAAVALAPAQAAAQRRAAARPASSPADRPSFGVQLDWGNDPDFGIGGRGVFPLHSLFPKTPLDGIVSLPVEDISATRAHLYLWCPNALLPDGLAVMRAWGFQYKTNLVWYKVRKDGGPDRRGVGFYFRNVTELCLFGIRGASNRTLAAGRRQPNIVVSSKREHSRKPDELYDVIEACSPGPYLELFARHRRDGWLQWGNEVGAPKALRATCRSRAGSRP